MSACSHSPPPDAAFAWSTWARCACGEVEYRRASARVELMTGAHYEGQRATDGTPIDSRRKHEAYMRAHGLAPASDYAQSFERLPQRRAEEDRQMTRELVDTIGRAAHTQRGRR